MKHVMVGFFVVLCLNAAAQVSVGQQAPDLVLPNAADSMIALSSLKGKVVLIDFWASWCGPCRQANPQVVKLYKHYHSKGFEVYAISIDVKKAAWLKAVKQDKITYLQVNDNGGWNAKSTALYGVDAIPTNFLLNKQGIIAAIDLEGKALERKVNELLEE